MEASVCAMLSSVVDNIIYSEVLIQDVQSIISNTIMQSLLKSFARSSFFGTQDTFKAKHGWLEGRFGEKYILTESEFCSKREQV